MNLHSLLDVRDKVVMKDEDKAMPLNTFLASVTISKANPMSRDIQQGSSLLSKTISMMVAVSRVAISVSQVTSD